VRREALTKGVITIGDLRDFNEDIRKTIIAEGRI
jgi:hypothetical protein